MGFKEFGLTFVILVMMGFALVLTFNLISKIEISFVQETFFIIGVLSLVFTFIMDKFVLTGRNQGIIQ